MRIAITMRSFEAEFANAGDAQSAAPDCFAEFEVEKVPVNEAANDVSGDEDADTVQVTVVLRGKRDELEDPALSMTELILGALRAGRAGNTNARVRQVIDAMGVGVESAW